MSGRPHLQVVPSWQVPSLIHHRVFLAHYGDPFERNGLFVLRDAGGSLYYASVGHAGRLHFWREVQR